MFGDLRLFLDALRARGEVRDIHAEVDPKLELAEIHRRVIAENGPALMFHRVKGSPYRVVTNMFGTRERVELAFGHRGEKFIREAATLPHELMPPTFGKIFQKRDFFLSALKVGMSRSNRGPVMEVCDTPPRLTELPVLTTWEEDGGPFFTLPLVYTEEPGTRIHNLGMYRLQRYSDSETGLHMQIGKGGGFHLHRAKELGQRLPVNVFLGGPPALILAAIAPLPENVGELILASLVLGKKVKLATASGVSLPFLADAEFVLCGECDPDERRAEGPFGDHYGYYSLTHDYPVFRCRKVFHRHDAIYPATVVGKPRQEDYYIGNYLQEMLSPLFPVVMPAVRSLWSYGETGYHSLAAAVVKERFRREAMVSAFRILGEGQLALTKFLLATDQPCDLKNFRETLTTILERCDFRRDLFVFSNLSMDTLDYTGPKINEGSKGVLLGLGDPIRELPRSFAGAPSSDVRDVQIFSPGCLAVSGPSYAADREFAARIARDPIFGSWPLICVVDDAAQVCSSEASFLWHVFTRFEPAADIIARDIRLERMHPAFDMPVVIDARMKPQYPAELECDEATSKLVNARWREYGLP
ncbi:MAG: UbiD family decarboxylase [Deltaproteobacteria bacterium]|nr:UbiD family decarboxylase [Deltaproteobacteria bacterium]